MSLVGTASAHYLNDQHYYLFELIIIPNTRHTPHSPHPAMAAAHVPEYRPSDFTVEVLDQEFKTWYPVGHLSPHQRCAAHPNHTLGRGAGLQLERRQGCLRARVG